ncbi:hypothetical protein A0H81_06862 [Grifola frondosa]|uniref:DUF1746 domain-containing protein n=1 Tax=Grifola frondosa TaxID=5627 RepID=A0A1C7M8J3_GRIFR|nr:hypothetical protein A0H81_06862 [Grifola frondosa]
MAHIGTMYFLTLLSINVMNLIVWNGDGLLSNIRIFTDPITAILICRFILNLRDVDSTDANGSYSRGNVVSTRSTVLRFAGFVEPLGAPLDDARPSAVDDDYEDSDSRGATLGKLEPVMDRTWSTRMTPASAKMHRHTKPWIRTSSCSGGPSVV